MLVEVLQKFLKLGLLFRRKDRADLIASLLTDPIDLRIRLIVNRFCLGMTLQQDRVQLLTLSAR